MSRASKLVHPATLFIQFLPYTEVAFKDMTPLAQRGLFEFMYYNGDGSWGENVENFEQALELYGDVRFGVGKFANDDTLKEAMLASSEDADEVEDVTSWFENRYVCGTAIGAEEPPVILNHQDVAPENGVFEWGFGWFYSYWVHLPETDFIRFLPDWNPDDHTGRGGQ